MQAQEYSVLPVFRADITTFTHFCKVGTRNAELNNLSLFQPMSNFWPKLDKYFESDNKQVEHSEATRTEQWLQN